MVAQSELQTMSEAPAAKAWTPGLTLRQPPRKKGTIRLATPLVSSSTCHPASDPLCCLPSTSQHELVRVEGLSCDSFKGEWLLLCLTMNLVWGLEMLLIYIDFDGCAFDWSLFFFFLFFSYLIDALNLG